MEPVYTAIMLMMALKGPGIVATREMPYESMQQCQAELSKAKEEKGESGYRYKFVCIGVGGAES